MKTKFTRVTLYLLIGLLIVAIIPKPAAASQYPFLGEIQIFSFGYAPQGWALCNGQLLPIQQNQALFSLLGTRYGGDGVTTFALPNLQGRVAIDGSYSNIGEQGGEKEHILTAAETPFDAHLYAGSSPGTFNAPVTTAVPPVFYKPAVAQTLDNQQISIYAPAADVSMYTGAGGSQAHNNMQPYLVLNFCIALQGIFPSQN